MTDVTVDYQEVTEDVAELHTDSLAIDDHVDDIIETHEHIDTLSSVTARMSQGEAACSVESIRITNVLVNSVMRKLNITDERPIPAIECFENRFERKAAYRLATEGLTDVLVKIWRAIKNAIVNLWKRISAFIKKFFDAAQKLSKMNEKLKSKLNDLTGYPGKDTFESLDIATAFSHRNKVDVSNVLVVLDQHIKITKDLKNISSVLSIVGNRVRLAKLDYLSHVEGVIEDPDRPIPGDAAIIGRATIGYDEISSQLKKSLLLVNSNDKEEGLIGVSDIPLIDGKVIKLYSNTNADKITELEVDISTSKIPINKFVRVLSINDMRSISKSIDELLKLQDVVVKSSESIGKFINDLTWLINDIEDTIKSLNNIDGRKDDIVELMKAFDPLKAYFNSMMSVVNKVYTTVPAMNVRAGLASMKYCFESIDKY